MENGESTKVAILESQIVSANRKIKAPLILYEENSDKKFAVFTDLKQREIWVECEGKKKEKKVIEKGSKIFLSGRCLIRSLDGEIIIHRIKTTKITNSGISFLNLDLEKEIGIVQKIDFANASDFIWGKIREDYSGTKIEEIRLKKSVANLEEQMSWWLFLKRMVVGAFCLIGAYFVLSLLHLGGSCRVKRGNESNLARVKEEMEGANRIQIDTINGILERLEGVEKGKGTEGPIVPRNEGELDI